MHLPFMELLMHLVQLMDPDDAVGLALRSSIAALESAHILQNMMTQCIKPGNRRSLTNGNGFEREEAINQGANGGVIDGE